MKPFLNPIEKPNSFAMKLAYYFSKKQFGKVIAPLRVIGPRMPAAFGLYFAKIEQLDKKLKTTLETNLLFRHQVASLNNCSFCLDQQRWGLIKWQLTKQSLTLWPTTIQVL